MNRPLCAIENCTRVAERQTSKVSDKVWYRKLCTKCRRDKAAYVPKVQLHYERYRMTKSEYDAILESQNGVCAICQNESSETLCVDHDHACCNPYLSRKFTCGKCNRALLCRKCNFLVGTLENNVETVDIALRYIDKFSS